MDNDKERQALLVDAIIGVGTGSFDVSKHLEGIGLAYWTGNQHNPSWEYRRDRLMRMDTTSLLLIYADVKGK